MKKKIGKRKVITLLILVVLILASCNTNDEQEKAARFISAAKLDVVEYTVVKVIKANDVPQWYQYGDRKILFNCKATLTVGVDMTKFEDSDVKINKASNSIDITLPKPEVQSHDINPDSITLLYEKVSMFRNRFTADDRLKLQAQGEKDILEHVDSMGIIKDAEKHAELCIRSLLQQAGYKRVNVKFKKEG